MTFTIRPAVAADYPALVPLAAAILAEHAEALPAVFRMIPEPLPDWYFHGMLRDPAYDIFVAAAAAAGVVGFVQLTVRSTADVPIYVLRLVATVENLIVARAHRGRGIGRALMAACVARARERRADSLDLIVWEPNAAALAFYERLGMQTRNRTMTLPLTDDSDQ